MAWINANFCNQFSSSILDLKTEFAVCGLLAANSIAECFGAIEQLNAASTTNQNKQTANTPQVIIHSGFIAAFLLL